MAQELTAQDFETFRKQFGADRGARMRQNAVTAGATLDVALSHDVVAGTSHVVSHRLDKWDATDQKKSGRCWLFAGLNLVRPSAIAQMKMRSFEFSQSYLMFFDKLERANYFLSAVAETADRDLDDRTIAHILDHLVEDGGQWNMFVNLVAKHGLVPLSVMPESESSGNSAAMNHALRRVLRRAAVELRDLASSDQIQECTQLVLHDVYRVLSIHLGTPPENFMWQWTDDDGEFHRDGVLTPRDFAGLYASTPLAEYVCLVHDPRRSSIENRCYTVDFLGNVVGGDGFVYLNVGMDVIKDVAKRTIVDGEAVWFGADVTHMINRKLGLFDAQLYDFEALYDVELGLGKAERIELHDTRMNHAMLFTGVDLHDRVPLRWRVENSWGSESGVSGFYTMTDTWFDDYVFEVAVRRTYLPSDLTDALERQPIILPAWDPMGALAH